MRLIKWVKRNKQNLLNVVIFFGFWLLIMMFISFNKTVAENARSAKETAENTNQIVRKQDETLKIIRQLSKDTKTTAEQKTNIIICMLQVPIGERTTDTVRNCRKQAEGTPSPNITPPSPSVKNTSQNTTLSQNKNSSTKTPSRQPGGGGTPQQPTYTQCVGSKTGILGTIMGVVSCL